MHRKQALLIHPFHSIDVGTLCSVPVSEEVGSRVENMGGLDSSMGGSIDSSRKKGKHRCINAGIASLGSSGAPISEDGYDGLDLLDGYDRLFHIGSCAGNEGCVVLADVSVVPPLP